MTVPDEDIVEAYLDMVENHKMVVENSGLLTVAALKNLDLKDKPAVHRPDQSVDGLSLFFHNSMIFSLTGGSMPPVADRPVMAWTRPAASAGHEREEA